MNVHRFLLLAGFVLGLGVATLHCGSSAKCGPSNCASGCCTSAGACVTGNTATNCGKGGATCSACTGAQVCVAQACGTTGGGGGSGGGSGGGAGGGSGGGSGGGDGGTSFTCSSVRTYSTPLTAAQVTSVRYRVFSDGTVWNRVRWDLDPSVDGGLYVYQQIYFKPSQVTPPVSADWIPYDPAAPEDGGTWYDSLTSVPATGTAMALTECDNLTGLCEKRYLGQAGTATYTSLGGNTAGRMAGSSTNVRLVAWDWQVETVGNQVSIIADEPLPNADCIDVASMSYDFTYTVMPDGGVEFDAGT